MQEAKGAEGSLLTDPIPRISKGSYILFSIVVLATLYDKRPNTAQPKMMKRLLHSGSVVEGGIQKLGRTFW